MAAISDVIEFKGKVDDLVWKSPVENFNTTSVLIVDETHKALVTVNGVQYGLYEAGRHILDTPNLPGGKNIVNMPTGGKSSFPCKVFYINMLHQMSMAWGIPGNIKLEDPVYEIFMDISARGTVNFVVTEPIKFMEKLVGFRDQFSPEELTDLDHGMFRGIISKWVTSDISKIMISGGISYFTISENLFEISEVLKEQLSSVFGEYGVGVQDFNIEAVVANAKNTAALSDAKQKHASRKVQGYTWQDERKMTILETAAGNTGALGGMQGAVGGFMMGGAIGGSLSDMVRDVLNMNSGSEAASGQGGVPASGRSAYNHIDPMDFLKNGAGKPTVNNFGKDKPAPQPTGVSFSNPQPAGAPSSNSQPTGVPFSSPQPTGMSFSNPQPTGMSFSNPQPKPQAEPEHASFPSPLPEKADQSAESVSPAPVQSKPEVPAAAPAKPVQNAPAASEKQDDKKRCGGCGKMVAMSFRFCPYCGGNNFPKTCPSCGSEVEEDFAFCPHCGTNLK